MRIYFAAPLFSEAERNYNELVVSQIEKEVKDVEIYLPQRNLTINDKSNHASPIDIVKGDDEHLLKSDLLICLLDGNTIDEGVACEIGVFSMLNRPILALWTDCRQQGVDNPEKIKVLIENPVSNPFMYRNLYVVGKILINGKVFSSVDDLVKAVKEYVEGELN